MYESPRTQYMCFATYVIYTYQHHSSSNELHIKMIDSENHENVVQRQMNTKINTENYHSTYFHGKN